MEKIIAFMKKRRGFASTKEMKEAFFQTRDIARLLREGQIERVRPGLYRLADFGNSGIAFSQGIIDVCRAMPEGVICLVSALEFYNLTTTSPSEIYVAIPHAGKKPKIEYPPVNVFFFRDRFYSPGIEKIRTPHAVIKVYNREKTVCDMFRYRKKLGEDLALEGLKNYLKLKDANINKLREYAEVCQVKTVMLPYLKALVG